jgi:hypothetical protein
MRGSTMFRRWLGVAALVVGAALSQPAAAGPTQPVMQGDVGIHDPTMIVVDGTYVAFYTGPEGGVDRGALKLKTSPDGITWKDMGSLGKGIPAWVQPLLGVKPPNLWAPSVSVHGGTYYLYYAASIFGMNLSAIGLMTNPHLDPAHPGDGWTDQGLVLQTGITDKFNAIDAFRIDTPDDRAWLSFGSYWDGIKLRELDPVSGKLKAGTNTIYSLATRFGAAIEASAILAHDGHYYLFVFLRPLLRRGGEHVPHHGGAGGSGDRPLCRRPGPADAEGFCHATPAQHRPLHRPGRAGTVCRTPRRHAGLPLLRRRRSGEVEARDGAAALERRRLAEPRSPAVADRGAGDSRRDQGRMCPPVVNSRYHSSRVSGTAEPAAASLTRSGLVVPSTTWILAGCRVIQATAMPVGVTP